MLADYQVSSEIERLFQAGAIFFCCVYVKCIRSSCRDSGNEHRRRLL